MASAGDTRGDNLPPKEKKLTVRKKFLMRMEREGRLKDWHQTIRRVQKETGKTYGPCSWIAMREMGYTTAAEEHRLHDEHFSNLHKTSAEIELSKKKAEAREEARRMNFEEVVASLPAKCSVSEELDWIRAHPAMLRKARQKDKTKDIVLSVDDLLCAPCGKAPSKSAVAGLEHWANYPNKFFEMLMSEHKKMSEDGGAQRESAKDVSLSEVERMLDEISSGDPEGDQREGGGRGAAGADEGEGGGADSPQRDDRGGADEGQDRVLEGQHEDRRPAVPPV